jgi:hypothetical protein
LLGGGEEVAVGQQDGGERSEGDASQQDVEEDELEADGVDWCGSSEQHADHGAGEEDQPGGLGGVDEGDHSRAQAAAQHRADGLGGGGAEGEGGFDLVG